VARTAPERIVCVSLAIVAIQAGAVARVTAQSVVPPRGQGTVSLTFEDYHHTGHYDRLGQKNDNGATESKVLIGHLDFGITDTIGLNVTLPFIASKYTGPDVYFVEGIETHPGPIDDRTYHAAFQDLRVEARRMFQAGPAAIMPFVGVAMPTHNYETKGEAIPGRGRSELQFGVNTETALDVLVPHAYVHGRYAYAILERDLGFSHTRSNIDLEPGYTVTPRIDLRGLIGWQIAHKRPTVPEMRPYWENHDRLVNANFLNAGAGTSFWLTETTEIYAFWAATVQGKRGAHVARILAIGVNWSFGGGGLPSLGR
jgi:hypothetical protein